MPKDQFDPGRRMLAELSQWYHKQCDGDWEHAKGITIRSCDNPGWWVQIDVAGTPLHDHPFDPVSEGVSEAGFPEADAWLRCFVREGVWEGIGDPSRLAEIIERFLEWAQSSNGRLR